MRKIVLGTVLGVVSLGGWAVAQRAADPQLENDLRDIDQAKRECNHIRSILKHVSDQYGMGNQYVDAEQNLNRLERHLDEGEDMIRKQIAHHKQ